MVNKKFPPWIKELKYKIRDTALGCGLDPFDVIFEVLDYKQMNEVASCGGFFSRYFHWRFGMEYEKTQKGYTYGLRKIYEMVINTDPCYAYLLEANTSVDQKLVIAHVYAHSDFFKNNFWFSQTNRKMLNEMANHGSRVARYIEKFGLEKVEKFIEWCMSIENLIDYHSLFLSCGREEKKEEESLPKIARFKTKDYMDRFLNPPEFIAEQEKKREEARDRLLKVKKGQVFPQKPEKDVLWFLIQYAPLEDWQRDILEIMRKESYYYAPQDLTKIMNEGWAAYWHSKMLTGDSDFETRELRTPPLLTDDELTDYADYHSGTLASQPHGLNPYALGMRLFQDIEDRWNKGRHGLEYKRCEDLKKKREWDTKEGRGREKIFEIRRFHNDITFIDEFLTPEFCEKRKLFTYKFNEGKNWWEIAERDFRNIKNALLFQLTNFGQPVICVVDGNYENKGELLLEHHYGGIPLDILKARGTLSALAHIWQRPVGIVTFAEESEACHLYSCDDKGIARGDKQLCSRGYGGCEHWKRWEKNMT